MAEEEVDEVFQDEDHEMIWDEVDFDYLRQHRQNQDCFMKKADVDGRRMA